MIPPVHFEPVSGRARAINARMYRDLAASLAYVAETIGGEIDFDEAALRKLCDGLEAGMAPDPLVFALYYQLVFAIAEEDAGHAADLLDTIVSLPPLPERELRIIGEDLGPQRSDLYARLIEEHEPLRLAVAQPDEEAVAAFRQVYPQAMHLIDSAAPELGDEIRGLARQIVLVGQGPDHETIFDGGSHFQIWNALFLNIQRPRSRVALAEVLAHETAHSLQFGFCIDEGLTLNDETLRYDSPLRHDPRPMDGIYHATFVSARMHWLMERLLAADLLEDEEREEAREALERDRENFEAGHAVVAEHGVMTDTGARLMAGARAYMDSASRTAQAARANRAAAAT